MQFGVSEDEARAFVGTEPDPDEFEVYPENWDALQLFLRLQTQWKRAGMSGHRIALDYMAAESVMRMFGIKRRKQGGMLDKLRVMEAAVLEADDDAGE